MRKDLKQLHLHFLRDRVRILDHRQQPRQPRHGSKPTTVIITLANTTMPLIHHLHTLHRCVVRSLDPG